MKIEKSQSDDRKIKTLDKGRNRIVIGNSTFFVNVHFGKIPLEDILRTRVLSNGTKNQIK